MVSLFYTIKIQRGKEEEEEGGKLKFRGI